MASLDVVARDLRERFGARYVSFLFVDIVDIVGRSVVRVTEEAATQQGRNADQIALAGSVYEEVLRSQKPVVTRENGSGCRLLAPVTNRGDAIGILELHRATTMAATGRSTRRHLPNVGCRTGAGEPAA